MPSEAIVLAMAVLGVLLGPYLVYGGLRYGIMDRRIQLHNTNEFATGRTALLRGIVYVVMGFVFTATSLLVLIGLGC